ncbi:hypothetical protein PaG_04555 [Moesziomyces aphidis]|uniref:Uncharacterized protein n=1 Tax=Moesziomyces aphidis TaxID=84754 RepID=W3VGF9_MOEAP|nr:hypothetical protein PaG_04555 [Moesziomyces aphidis]
MNPNREVGRRSRVAKGKRTSVASDRRLSLSPGSCAFGVGAGAKRHSAVAATVSPLLVPDTGGWKVAKMGGCPRLPVHGAALQPAATRRVRQLRQLMLLTPACRPSCIRWVRPNVAGMLPNDDASSGCRLVDAPARIARSRPGSDAVDPAPNKGRAVPEPRLSNSIVPIPSESGDPRWIRVVPSHPSLLATISPPIPISLSHPSYIDHIQLPSKVLITQNAQDELPWL